MLDLPTLALNLPARALLSRDSGPLHADASRGPI